MLRTFTLAPLLMLLGCNGHAGAYLIEPAPESQAHAASATAKVFLAPFADARKSRVIYRGRADYENVSVDAAGRTLLAKAWQALPAGDLSYLWHRQLLSSLNEAGYSVSAASEPMSDEQAMLAAKNAGADLLMQGEIKKLGISKRGADSLIGTNFTGTNYIFYSLHDARLKPVGPRGATASASLDFERVFYNAERLGAADRDTFPQYFVRGLPEAARHLADDSALRAAVGLPTCTATPTQTSTPEPTKKGSPAPTPAGNQPTLTPTPDKSPYWYNPHTGHRVDPKYNFDPEDGTPKKDFILKSR